MSTVGIGFWDNIAAVSISETAIIIICHILVKERFVDNMETEVYNGNRDVLLYKDDEYTQRIGQVIQIKLLLIE